MATSLSLLDDDFIQGLPDELKCPVCLDLLSDPYIVNCCGKHYCFTCINTVCHSKGPVCPVCQQRFTAVGDPNITRRINALRIECPNKDHGCDWVGEYKHFDNHIKEMCDCMVTLCELGCGKYVPRRHLEKHNVHLCPNRVYNCEYCEKYKNTFEDVEKNHWPVCECFPVPCPNDCPTGSVPRGRLMNHLMKECRTKAQLTRARIKSEDLGQKVQDLEQQVKLLQEKEESLREEIKKDNEKILLLEQELVNEKEESRQLIASNQELKEKVKHNRENEEGLREVIQTMNREDEEQIHQLECKLVSKSEDYEQLLADNQKMQESNNKKIQQMKHELAREREKYQQLLATYQELEECVKLHRQNEEELREELRRNEEKIKKLEHELTNKREELIASNQDLREQIKRHREKEEELKEETRERIQQLELDLESETGFNQQLNIRIQELRENEEELQEQLQAKNKEELEEQVKLHREREEELEEMQAKDRDEIQQLKHELATQKEDHQQLIANNQELEEQVKLHKETEEKLKEEIQAKEDEEAAGQRLSLLHNPNLTLQWNRFTNLPGVMCEASAVLCGGYLYTGGGIYQRVGSYDDCRVFKYDFVCDSWSRLPTTKRYRFTLVSFNDKLLVVGGKTPDGSYLKTLLEWDDDIWKEDSFPPMNRFRKKPAAVRHGDHIAVAGGSNESGPGSSVEVFSNNARKWYLAKSLPFSLSRVTSALLNSRWYLLGGKEKTGFYISIDGLVRKAMNAPGAEDEDVKWESLANTPSELSTATAFGECFLAIGGKVPVHAYLHGRNYWIPINSLYPLTPVYSAAVVAISPDELLVIGGNKGFSRYDCVYKVTLEQFS